MKKIPATILQIIVVLISITALLVLIRFPLLEGRAQNLDLVSIYADPFILYGYASSIAVFVGLYQVFRLLTNVRQNQLHSPQSLKMLVNIKYCAITFGVLLAIAAVYVKLTHHPDDDPVGFLAMSMVLILISVTVAVAVTMLEKRLTRVA